MSSVNPIPDRYRRITPALIVREGVKALEFYAEVFQATERTRFPGPGGTIAHAEIEVDRRPFGHGWTVASHLEDVDPREAMRRMAEMMQNEA
jgi:hypothetical protein